MTLARFILAGVVFLALGACDSDGDAQHLSNLVDVANNNYNRIEIQESASVIRTGRTIELTVIAFAEDAEADVPGVPVTGAIWSSNDSNVADVSNGFVTAGALDDEVTITADYGNLIATRSLRISSADLNRIVIEADGFGDGGIQVDECGSIQLLAMGIYDGEEGQSRDETLYVNWDVLPTDSARFDDDTIGLLRVSANGELNVTAVFGDEDSTGTPGSETVTVRPNLDSLVITPQNTSINVGTPLQFTATATYDTGATADVSSNVNWNINDGASSADFADEDGTGLVTANRAGDGQLVASCGEKSDSIPIRAIGGTIVELQLEPENAQRDSTPLRVSFNGSQVTEVLKAKALYASNGSRDVSEDADWKIDSVSSGNGFFSVSDESGSKGEVTISGEGSFVVRADFIDEDNDDNPLFATMSITVY